MNNKNIKEGWNGQQYFFGYNDNEEAVYIDKTTAKFYVGNQSTKTGYEFLLELLTYDKPVDAGEGYNNLKKKDYFPDFLKKRIECVGGSSYIYKSNSNPFVQEEIYTSDSGNNEELHVEILRNTAYQDIRKDIIENNTGDFLYISGPSLNEAFKINGKNQIITTIKGKIKDRTIKDLFLFMTDPVMFKNKKATADLTTSLEGIKELLDVAKDKDCKIHITYLPLINIDHSIITDDEMLFRTTKFWSNSREQKGSILYFTNIKANREALAGGYNPPNEYDSQLSALKKMHSISMQIDLQDDYFLKCGDLDKSDKSYTFHFKLRKYLKDEEFETCVDLRRMLYSQIKSYAKNLWLNEDEKKELKIDYRLDFHKYNVNGASSNLSSKINQIKHPITNDKSQQILCNYLKTTEDLLKKACEKMSPGLETDAMIIPSADLGYPNNVVRLAGGFPTGEMITWECGVPIIPIDATVNVCTSSVIKINPNEEVFESFDSFAKIVENLKETVSPGSFDFASGNHFLMLAADASNPNDIYLVLHSSESENKNSYTGLYPNENNWYSDRIKIEYGEDNRYLRYITGRDAEWFYKQSKMLEKSNEEIHKNIALLLSEDNEIDVKNAIIKHHYGMPNSHTIIIGTFLAKSKEVVPIFSDYGKDIILFEVGEKNWFINVEGKGDCTLIPHGFGQAMPLVDKISINSNKLCLMSKHGDIEMFEINSKSRIDSKNKSIRRIRSKYNRSEVETFIYNAGIDGRTIKTLTPCKGKDGHFLIYCRKSLEK